MLYIAAAMAGALPPVLLKEYNNRKLTHPDSRYIFILISIIVSLTLIYIYMIIFEKNAVGPFYALSKILSIIMVTAGGALFFEDVITIKQSIGIIFGIITIILLTT